jgi:hypothetical protein
MTENENENVFSCMSKIELAQDLAPKRRKDVIIILRERGGD